MRSLLVTGLLLAGPLFAMAAQADEGFGVLRFLHNATQEARMVVFFARREVILAGGDAINTEHLLLGLIRQDPSLVGRFLSDGDSTEKVRSDLIRALGADPDLGRDYNPTRRDELMPTLQRETSTSREVPLSTECGQLLILAYEQARQEQMLKTNGQEPVELPLPQYWNRSDTPSEMTDAMKEELARMEEAVRKGARPYVQTKHVLLAILSVPGTPAEQMLSAHGVKLDEVRRAFSEDEAEE